MKKSLTDWSSLRPDGTPYRDRKQITIKAEGVEISDGYHTFSELYEHRIALYVALCKNLKQLIWRSRLHSDGTSIPGWFILGINDKPGEQITYHLPESWWDKTDFARTMDYAPEWDRHTSVNVIERLAKLADLDMEP